MKAILIIVVWVMSLFTMSTDSPIQLVVAVVVFGVTSWLLNRYRRETMQKVVRMERWIDRVLIKK